MTAAPWPIELRVRRAARRLEIDFDDGARFDLSAALLRAMTPSASARGHGVSRQAPLAEDFSEIALLDARAVGAYAVRLVFDDGHDSGLYTWSNLYGLGRNKDALEREHRRLIAGR